MDIIIDLSANGEISTFIKTSPPASHPADRGPVPYTLARLISDGSIDHSRTKS